MHPAHFSCHAHDHCRRGIDLIRSLSRNQRINLKIGRVVQRQRLALQRRFGPLQVMPFHVPGNDRGIAAQTARNLRHAAPAEIQQPHRPSVPFGDVSSLCSSSHARSVTQVRMGRIHFIRVSSRKTRSLCPGPSICRGFRRLGPGYFLRKFRDDRVDGVPLILPCEAGEVLSVAKRRGPVRQVRIPPPTAGFAVCHLPRRRGRIVIAASSFDFAQDESCSFLHPRSAHAERSRSTGAGSPALNSSPARPRYIARGTGRRTGRSRRPSSRWRISRTHSRDR